VNQATHNPSSSEVREPTDAEKAKGQKEQKRIIGLIAIFVIFVSCWMPLMVTYIIDYKQQLPSTVYVLFMTAAYINSSVNFYLYAVTNLQLRYVFKCILTCKFSSINRKRI
jgi:hypothetical protein